MQLQQKGSYNDFKANEMMSEIMQGSLQGNTQLNRQENADSPKGTERDELSGNKNAEQENNRQSQNPTFFQKIVLRLTGKKQKKSSEKKRSSEKKKSNEKKQSAQKEVSQFDEPDQKCSRKKLLLIVISITVLIAIGAAILGFCLRYSGNTNITLTQPHPGTKVVGYRFYGGYLKEAVRADNENFNLVNVNGEQSLQGENSEQNFREIQKDKFQINVPFISLIEAACSSIDQDANKVIQSQSGVFKFYQAVLLYLGRQGLNVTGTNNEKAVISNIDKFNRVRIEYSADKGIFIESKQEQELANLDSATDQPPLSNANLPECSIQKAVPLIAASLKRTVEKNLKAFRRETANGGKEELQSLVGDSNDSDQTKELKKQFTENCIYISDATYNCKIEALEKVVAPSTARLLQGSTSEPQQSDRLETEYLSFTVEI